MMPAIPEVVLSAGNSPAASIVGVASVVLALGLIGSAIARNTRAALRHALLAAAFGGLLVLPAISIFGPSIRIVLSVAKQEPAAIATPGPAQGISATVQGSNVVPDSRPGFSIAALLLAAWASGAALVLARVLIGLWQVRSLRRSALPWARGRLAAERVAPGCRVEVLLHEKLPGPMTCGILRSAIVLPAETQNWDAEDLERAMVHELEHVRRSDWAIQCAARAVCALYWFHPLVWMAWRRLALEAERSCDDAVLGCSEAPDYADQLVELAERLSSVEKSPMLAMANRSDLATRVSALLDNRQQRGRAGTVSVALACVAAAAVVLMLAPVRLVAAPPQQPITAADAMPMAQPESAPAAAAEPALAPPSADSTPQQSTNPPAQSTSAVNFRARSNLVLVNVTVTDATGKSIDGLGARDFSLMEDGVPQTISMFEFQAVTGSPGSADTPANYYVLGYYPTNSKADGQFRRIQVIDKNDTTATVKYRSGYYPNRAPGAPGNGADVSQPKALPPGARPPVLIYKREADYSEEARKAKYQGDVMLTVEVTETGSVSAVKVLRSLGLGLDEKAVEAVKQWKFKPGTQDGAPTAMEANVTVSFRLQ